MRRAAAQHGAAEARLGIETDRVTHRRHGQRIGQQQRNQRQRMRADAAAIATAISPGMNQTRACSNGGERRDLGWVMRRSIEIVGPQTVIKC